MHFHTWDERLIYRSALPPILPHLFLRLLFFACDHFIAYHKGYEPVAFTTSLRKWTNCFLIPAHTSRRFSETLQQGHNSVIVFRGYQYLPPLKHDSHRLSSTQSKIRHFHKTMRPLRTVSLCNQCSAHASPQRPSGADWHNGRQQQYDQKQGSADLFYGTFLFVYPPYTASSGLGCKPAEF